MTEQQPKKQPAAAEGGIDWANVASEVRTMLELNRSATENWRDGEQKGKQKPEDG